MKWKQNPVRARAQNQALKLEVHFQNGNQHRQLEILEFQKVESGREDLNL
jgi:hypothetical protein